MKEEDEEKKKTGNVKNDGTKVNMWYISFQRVDLLFTILYRRGSHLIQVPTNQNFFRARSCEQEN